MFGNDRLEVGIPIGANFFRDVRSPKDVNKLFYTLENWRLFPNYHLTNMNFKETKPVTDLNLHITDTFN